jgi:protein-disulfide isomerase
MSDPRLVRDVGTHDHVVGPDDAVVTLVEYGDFECPYCGAAHPIVRAARRELGNTMRFVYRHFPLTGIHSHAEAAAQIAEAAAAQGRFWEMHDMLLSNQRALRQVDLLRYARDLGLDVARVERELLEGTHVDRVREDFRGGVRSGVNGTPTFFINGKRFDGQWSNQREFISALHRSGQDGQSGLISTDHASETS